MKKTLEWEGTFSGFRQKHFEEAYINGEWIGHKVDKQLVENLKEEDKYKIKITIEVERA